MTSSNPASWKTSPLSAFWIWPLPWRWPSAWGCSSFWSTRRPLPLDIAFLFWSIAVGIVLAAGMIPLAVFGSVFIGAVLLVFVNKKSHADPYIVVIQCGGRDSETRASAYLEQHTEIRLKDGNTDFINTLAELEGVDSAVLVSYNGDYMG